MSKIFVTSDHHFGHSEVINYPGCERPFKDVEEMDAALIERWNQVVGLNDTVYHLGDFSLEAIVAHYFNRLNGKVYVLNNPWHHDKEWITRETATLRTKQGQVVRLLPPIVSVEVTLPVEKTIILSHYPLGDCEFWNLHGHGHGTLEEGERAVDVGVDCFNFYPVDLLTVL